MMQRSSVQVEPISVHRTSTGSWRVMSTSAKHGKSSCSQQESLPALKTLLMSASYPRGHTVLEPFSNLLQQLEQLQLQVALHLVHLPIKSRKLSVNPDCWCVPILSLITKLSQRLP